ncbi:indole-3-glycerol phosphate synthase TrpC [Hutsoniella sourekii]|uniref:indole-3-glycerol phosphate synthase TrpC n=1 Tax=Hutsoniella sourekii TaxID=87650 RepID=UPI0004815121|nr:indole-3-glycerol phosphate synthase TrpC [Hutsoniella sourekii]
MILDQLAQYSRDRVRLAQASKSLSAIQAEALALPRGDFPFEKAMANPGLSLIGEVKKASPSKGIISEDFPYLEIADQYQTSGVDAISVLTEPKWFLGSDQIFQAIRQRVDLPMLRKDFTVDPYQIYEAKLLGADCVLVIVALLDQDLGRLQDYLSLCDQLGLSALVEAHDLGEIELACQAGARIIGVNNRNLKDFSVDFNNAERLRDAVPEGILFVAESGVQTVSDVQAVTRLGADAVLVGEALMRQKQPGDLVRAFKRGAADAS